MKYSHSFHRLDKIPSPGQRCLVWRNRYQRWEFAYFDRDNFYQTNDGALLVIYDIDFWMAEPEDVKREDYKGRSLPKEMNNVS